tara:strand:- start:882 stop:1304 length:423 start_codon:yes stop_codon:yes gene_type:complete
MATKKETKKEVKLSSNAKRVIERLRKHFSSVTWASAKNKETKAFRNIQLADLESEYNAEEWFSLWFKVADLNANECHALADTIASEFKEQHKGFTLGLEHPHPSKNGSALSLGILKRQGKSEPKEIDAEYEDAEDDNLPF